jgi:hypothetical protein
MHVTSGGANGHAVPTGDVERRARWEVYDPAAGRFAPGRRASSAIVSAASDGDKRAAHTLNCSRRALARR